MAAGDGPIHRPLVLPEPADPGRVKPVIILNYHEFMGVPVTADLAAVPQLHNALDLPERDRGAAEAVAAGLRDAKAGNTRRA